MNLQDQEDRIVASGEYVLGTLDAATRSAFESALATDSDLQAEVYRWQDRLLALAQKVSPAEVAPQLWREIEARLGRPLGAVPGTPSSMSSQAQPMANASDFPAQPLQAANDALYMRLRVWQATGSFALAACAVMAALLVLDDRPASAPAAQISSASPVRYVTMLQDPEKPSGWIVEVSNDRLRLVPVGPATAVPSGKSLQFWTKLDGADGPTSLGLVQPGQAIELPLKRLPGVAEKQLFELTLEPEAGSPIGKPTGPILFVGRSVRI
ncbi:MAG: anti-sigma factor [Burkholderiales bacterium]